MWYLHLLLLGSSRHIPYSIDGRTSMRFMVLPSSRIAFRSWIFVSVPGDSIELRMILLWPLFVAYLGHRVDLSVSSRVLALHKLERNLFLLWSSIQNLDFHMRRNPSCGNEVWQNERVGNLVQKREALMVLSLVLVQVMDRNWIFQLDLTMKTRYEFDCLQCLKISDYTCHCTKDTCFFTGPCSLRNWRLRK